MLIAGLGPQCKRKAAQISKPYLPLDACAAGQFARLNLAMTKAATDLRKRIANSAFANHAVAAVFGAWARLVRATSRRKEEGWAQVETALATHGAVIIVCWHQRLMMTPFMFDVARHRCRSLTSDARAGRLVGHIHRHFGYESVPMPHGILGAAEMRLIFKGLREGISIGVSPDGPRGPARVAKSTPIQWARSAQVPVVSFTFSAKHYLRWPTWDRLIFPLPFTKLHLRWRVWEETVPSKLSDAETAAFAQRLQSFMNAEALAADRMVGHKTTQL